MPKARFAEGMAQTQIALRLFTVIEFERMAATGILNGSDRVELIEGQVVEMTQIDSQHVWDVERIRDLFASKLGCSSALVRAQSPMRLAIGTEPQPDIAIVRFREDGYRLRHPGPEEVLLLIEVADSSLASDRNIKAPLYGAAGVPELWIIDIRSRALYLYRSPFADGYEEHFEIASGALLLPRLLPDLLLTADEVLGALPPP